MRNPERLTPIAALLSAATSLVCCLPFALPAALGIASIAVTLGRFRPWLTLASLVLLAVGFVQLYRKRACGRRSKVSLVLFAVAALVVLGLALFPQLVASVLADMK